MSQPTVYLGGPISGLTYEEASQGWRLEALNFFVPLGINVLSPLRGKQCLEAKGKIAGAYKENQLSTPRGILGRDFSDIQRADAILACFLDECGVSIGTVWEIGAAHALRKPIIVVLPPVASVHAHPFVVESATYVYHDPAEAMRATALLLGAS